MARALAAGSARFAKSALSLKEVAAHSMLHEFAESATTSLLPRTAVSTFRSTAQPCCTIAGALYASKSWHLNLKANIAQESNKGCIGCKDFGLHSE